MDDRPITRLLSEASQGDRLADDRLIAAVVGRLEQIAAREMMAGNRGGLDGLTMEPRMLAHDALLKILDHEVRFENRRHFFSYATSIITRAITDYHRRRNALKRGGPQMKVSLVELSDEAELDLSDVTAALEELEGLDQRKAELVRLRVFWGANMSEIAELLEISESTAERDWRFAKRWLAARLGSDDSAASRAAGTKGSGPA